MQIDEFVTRWAASGAANRANTDSFLNDLCDALGVRRPDVTTGDPERDTYVFEKDAVIVHEGGKRTVGRIDLYKQGCFIIEAKQGANAGSRKTGTAKRDTPGWNVAMLDAYGQALGYARTMDAPPPFVMVTDIGFCIDLYASFDGTGQYRPFPNAQQHRLHLLEMVTNSTLRAVFTDPMSLDPSRRAARVTREVAAHLADLARELEGAGNDPEHVARFLMRCIFTMFAEDVGLLPNKLFTRVLATKWIADPKCFPRDVENLWTAMDQGGPFGFEGMLRQFNGGLFRDVTALPLSRAHLERLLEAAKCNWADVEPAIFGTLVERALDPRERHRIGAHYTPRAYVERLVRPTIEEPLREAWDVVRAEVRRLVGEDYTAIQGRKTKKIADAREVVKKFHQRLCDVRVLDPACGSGNFLYVTLDIFKRLESEILALLEQLGDKRLLMATDQVMVRPAQFLGIEKKRWAKEIAEIVLWIGFLQWHARTRRNTDGSVMWLEPVLMDLNNIECRDAVLVWSSEDPVYDAKGEPVTRWDGVTMKKHPVTGAAVPDDLARVPVTEFVDPRRATWPPAEFVVGNPPFIGGWKMRQTLGEGYVEALRHAHEDVPDACDLVMYWWNHAAKLVRDGMLQRSGLVTTTTISQVQSRRVTQPFLEEDAGLSLVFAVDDHPWATDRYGSAGESAEVRVAMTVLARGRAPGTVAKVTREFMDEKDELVVEVEYQRGWINADLRIGANVSSALRLVANAKVSSPGVKLHGAGFIVTAAEASALGLGQVKGLEEHIRAYRNGKDLASIPRGVMVIDLDGLNVDSVREMFPAVYQRVLEKVKPERDHNNEQYRRENWWLFGRRNTELRAALKGLPRYIATPETARRRYFVVLSQDVLPDNAVVAIALDDWFHLGVLSSRIHTVWALAAGGGLGVRHEPRYNKTRCFDPFPFPDAGDVQRKKIRLMAERLDQHRRARQAEHPTLTLNAMYSALEKLRGNATLTDKDKATHVQGLVSVLQQLHDQLDTAVFEAYGWPTTLSDQEILERVVLLNAERGEEERNGLVRWLRPDFQNPKGYITATQQAIAEDEGVMEGRETVTALDVAPWPKQAAEQFVAVRTVLRSASHAWTAERVAKRFRAARREQVVEALQGLVSLGLAVGWSSSVGDCWQAVKTIAG